MDKLKLSERFACEVAGQHRSTQFRLPRAQTADDPDAGLRDWLREYAKEHPRWAWKRAYHARAQKGGPHMIR